jgi:beta-glucosidase
MSAGCVRNRYFVPWRTAVQQSSSKPTGYMCSYNAVNGVPACASKMLSDTIRSWGFSGYCGTDCSAADGIFDAHGYANDITHAYADAVNGGTDLICNPHNMTALHTAVATGLITPQVLDQALRRSFGVLFQLGLCPFRATRNTGAFYCYLKIVSAAST